MSVEVNQCPLSSRRAIAPEEKYFSLEAHKRACEEARAGWGKNFPGPLRRMQFLVNGVIRLYPRIYGQGLQFEAGVITSRLNRTLGLDATLEEVMKICVQINGFLKEGAPIAVKKKFVPLAVFPPDLPEWETPFPFKMCKSGLAEGEARRFIKAHGGFWQRSGRDLLRIAKKRGVSPPMTLNSITVALSRWRCKHKPGEEP